MGREIRKVPKGWEHPKNENGHYQPMHDQNYLTVLDEWFNNHRLWVNKQHPDQLTKDRSDYEYYAEWAGNPPEMEYYRKYQDDDCSCLQVYETVSEGTPVSPVFDSMDKLQAWLITQGHSEKAAAAFCEHGSAPSMMIMNGQVKSGIDTYDL